MKGEIIAIDKLEDDNKIVKYQVIIVTDDVPKLLLGSCEINNILLNSSDGKIDYTG